MFSLQNFIHVEVTHVCNVTHIYIEGYITELVCTMGPVCALNAELIHKN